MGRLVFEWRMGKEIIDWLKKQQIRAVILAGYNDPARMRVILWCHRHQIPCFISGDSNIRDASPSKLKAAIKQIILRAILRGTAGAMPFGTLGRAYFEKYGVRSDRIFLVPLEPDIELIQRLPKEAIDAAARRFGLASGRRRFLYSGRLIQRKRPDQLIEAFVAIAESRPDWDLVILGDGPLGPSLRKQVPTSLAQRVFWLGHAGQQATVSAVYKLCDVLCITSELEPWAIVIHEAVAAGLAVISSSIPGAAADLVRDKVNGRVYPARDLIALTQAMLDVSDSNHLETYKAASAGVLADWEHVGDPVRNVRDALNSLNLIPEPA
ncbi:MAG TPA: glycosyltransferase [Tepidisphaeraceae bacterium]|nr:glycosyltransferase [Tepidisphaeraceae bacterium]